MDQKSVVVLVSWKLQAFRALEFLSVRVRRRGQLVDVFCRLRARCASNWWSSAVVGRICDGAIEIRVLGSRSGNRPQSHLRLTSRGGIERAQEFRRLGTNGHQGQLWQPSDRLVLPQRRDKTPPLWGLPKRERRDSNPRPPA
jgi:hypothetical protein